MSSKSEVEKSVEELEKEITCAICGEHYTDPRVLPCCHYYCKQCVFKLAIRTGLSRPFSCPECRVDTLLPQNTVDNLPVAFFINRMQDLFSRLKQAQSKVENQCGVCSGGSKVTAYCRTCIQFICEDCVKAHQRIKIFLSHKVTSLDSLTEVEACKLLTEAQSPVQVCGNHDQPMSLYCFDCAVLICRDCTINDHFNHNHKFVKKAALEAKEFLASKLSSLQNLAKSFSESAAKIQSLKLDIEKHGNILDGKIRASFRELQQILVEHEQELLNESSLQINKKLECLESQETSIAQSMSVVLGVIDYTEHCLQHCTDNEVMTLRDEIQVRIDKTVKEQRRNDTDLEPAEEMNLTVDICSAQDLKLHIQSKAVIKSLLVDPLQCTVVGSGFRFAEVGKLAEFNITTRLSNGKHTKQKSTISCHLKPPASGSIIECKIAQLNLGEYVVQYLPTVRGPNYLNVKVNGQEIADSPLHVCAYVPPTDLNEPISITTNINVPHGIAVNSAGDIIVTEWNGGVLTFDKSGKKLTQKSIKKSDYNFDRLTGVGVDRRDNVYVVDRTNRIFKFSEKMDFIKSIKHKSTSSNLSGIAVSCDQVFVSDRNMNSISVYSHELIYIKQIHSHNIITSRQSGIFDLSVDHHGNLYLSHYGNGHVQVVSTEGELLHHFATDGGDKFQPRGISVTGEFVYVANETDHKLCVFSLDGEPVASFGKWGTGKGEFYSPSGVCVRDSYVYVCDRFNNRVQVF